MRPEIYEHDNTTMGNVIEAGKTFKDNIARIIDAMVTNTTLAEKYVFPDLLGMSESEINADFKNLSTINEMVKNFSILFTSPRIFLMKQPTVCSVLPTCVNSDEYDSDEYGSPYGDYYGYSDGYSDYGSADYNVDITWDLAYKFYYYGYSDDNDTSWDFSAYNSTYEKIVADLSVVDKYKDIIAVLFNNITPNASVYESHTVCQTHLTDVKEDILKKYNDVLDMIQVNIETANGSLQVQDIFNDTVKDKLNVVLSWLFPESYPKELDLRTLEEIHAHITQNSELNSRSMDALYDKHRNYDGTRFQCGWLKNTFSRNILYEPDSIPIEVAAKVLGEMTRSVKFINQTIHRGFDSYINGMTMVVNSATENYLNGTITKKELATIISNEDLNNKFLELTTHFSQLETFIDQLSENLDEFVVNRQWDYEDALDWENYPLETLKGNQDFPVLQTLIDWFINKGGKAKLNKTKAFSPDGGHDINSIDETNIWQFLKEAFTGLMDFTRDVEKNVTDGLVKYKKVILGFLQEMKHYLELTNMDTDIYM